jgi:hypothetical protein
VQELRQGIISNLTSDRKIAIASMFATNPFANLKRSGAIDEIALASKLCRKIEHSFSYAPTRLGDVRTADIVTPTLYVSLPPTSLRKSNVRKALDTIRSEFPDWIVIAKEIDFDVQP